MSRPPRFITHTLALLLFVLPASTNYEMHDVGFGGGGVGLGDSANYTISGIAGEVSSTSLGSTSYDLGPGLQFTRQTRTPIAPTFINSLATYNKLKFTINPSSNPTDTLFSLAISNDGFSTTNYIQADGTVGPLPIYQTYSTWGGAAGAYVVGLDTNTTYSLKTRAVQTKYTESAFSAVATAATSVPSLSYDIDVSASDTETAAPYVVNFGTLSIGSVTTATERIWIDLNTNAEAGAFVYLYADTAGLNSASTAYTIPSISDDLNAVSEGYGVRSASVTQSSGSVTANAPYNGANESVGLIDTTSRTIYQSSAAPILNGRMSLFVKAKASVTTPSASDYTSVITMIASAVF